MFVKNMFNLFWSIATGNIEYKMYTKSSDESLLKEINNDGMQFTDKEHAYVTERAFADRFKSKESLLQWYLGQNAIKLSALEFLIEYINKKKFKNIISLGAGPCVLEYLLDASLHDNCKVVASDFDSFLIEKSKILFPSITSVKFDFFKDDITELQKKLNIHFDLAIFFSSSYVMDNSQFINLFKGLKEIGVNQIIDFCGGYINYQNVLRIIKSQVFYEIRNTKILDKIKPPGFKGKFHGYARGRCNLRMLYKEAGIDLIKELSVTPYKYVTICNC